MFEKEFKDILSSIVSSVFFFFRTQIPRLAALLIIGIEIIARGVSGRKISLTRS
jgi:hypothetical protein